MELSFYKPNKSQKGGAIKFNVHKSGKFTFMKAAGQIAPMGERKVFGWADDNVINAKMGLNDLGSMLSVIRGYLDATKLFHKTDNDNKIIEFKHVPDREGFSLSISQQKTGQTAFKVFIGLTYAEVMILKVYAENAIHAMLEAAVWTGERE